MSKTKAKTLTAEDELDGAPKAPGTMKIAFEFPEGISRKAIEQVMKTAGDITKREMVKNASMREAREDYMREGGRRWRCIVHSLRAGVPIFELIIGDPKNPDRPIKVGGKCGVILEDGLTKCVIDRLQEEHSFRMEEVPPAEIDRFAIMALDYRQVYVPHYRVEVFKEIKNPIPVGKVGHKQRPQTAHA